MAQYNYKAMDKNGKAKKGSIEAINLDKAKEKLKSEGLIVQDIKEQGAGKKGGGKKVKDKDLAVFCKQFQSILHAGVTVIQALGMLGEQCECRCYDYQCVGNDVRTAGKQNFETRITGSSVVCAKGWYTGGCIQIESKGIPTDYDQHDSGW